MLRQRCGSARTVTRMRRSLAGAVIGAAVLSGCGIANTPEENRAKTADGTPVEVVYYVEGSAKSVSVAVKGPKSPKLLFVRGVALPMQTKHGEQGLRWMFKSGDEVFIQVQVSKAGGVATCRIEASGRLVSEQTADGPRNIAVCQGHA